MNGWITRPGESLTLTLDKAYEIGQVRMIFESNFAYPIRVTMSPNRQAQQRPGVPKELVKDLCVEFLCDGKVVKRVEIQDNHQRLCRVDAGGVKADAVRITPLDTNGAEEVIVHEVRIYQ